MKPIIGLFSSLAIMGSVISFAHANEDSKIYHSISEDYNSRIIVVPFGEQSDNSLYILHFDGLDKYFDQRTGLYEKQRIDDSQRYQYKQVDTPFTHMRANQRGTLIDGSWIASYQVYLPEGLKFDVVYTGEADIVKARNIREQYALEQGQFKSKVAAKREVKKALKEFESSCGSTPTIDLDWEQFASLGQKSLPGQFSKSLIALQKICEIDEDYKQAVQEITQITVKPSDNAKASLSLDKNQITFNLSNNAANVQTASYQNILKLL